MGVVVIGGSWSSRCVRRGKADGRPVSRAKAVLLVQPLGGAQPVKARWVRLDAKGARSCTVGFSTATPCCSNLTRVPDRRAKGCHDGMDAAMLRLLLPRDAAQRKMSCLKLLSCTRAPIAYSSSSRDMLPEIVRQMEGTCLKEIDLLSQASTSCC